MLRTKVEHEGCGRDGAALRGVPELTACDDAELGRIDELAVEVVRPAGTILQRAGRPLRQAFVVVSGTVAEQGATERVLPSGTFVGASLLDGDRTAGATVVATTPVRLLVFGLSEMDELGSMVGIRAAADGARVPAIDLDRAPARTRRPALAPRLAARPAVA